MEIEEKKQKLKNLVIEMLDVSNKTMKQKVDDLLKSKAINIDEWDTENSKMILPKEITAALLSHEQTQYMGKGTSFEKRVKKNVEKLKYFM